MPAPFPLKQIHRSINDGETHSTLDLFEVSTLEGPTQRLICSWDLIEIRQLQTPRDIQARCLNILRYAYYDLMTKDLNALGNCGSRRLFLLRERFLMIPSPWSPRFVLPVGCLLSFLWAHDILVHSKTSDIYFWGCILKLFCGDQSSRLEQSGGEKDAHNRFWGLWTS